MAVRGITAYVTMYYPDSDCEIFIIIIFVSVWADILKNRYTKDTS